MAVGGSGVGAHLIKRILQSHPDGSGQDAGAAHGRGRGPAHRSAFARRARGRHGAQFLPDLDRHLAACDLALVQGGLTTCMELAAAGTPFLYFPLRNHFEQNFHVAHRLDRYGAGRRMDYAAMTPDKLAAAMVEALATPSASHPVEADGAARAARMIAEML